MLHKTLGEPALVLRTNAGYAFNQSLPSWYDYVAHDDLLEGNFQTRFLTLEVDFLAVLQVFFSYHCSPRTSWHIPWALSIFCEEIKDEVSLRSTQVLVRPPEKQRYRLPLEAQTVYGGGRNH